jgi:hypothetical protein
MLRSKPLGKVLFAAGLLGLLMFASYVLPAQTFQVLHTFTGGNDGAVPLSGLIADRAGNLYGTANGGSITAGGCDGAYGCGNVFQMKRVGSAWIFKPLYQFQGGADGGNPAGRVVFAPNGQLYGTTEHGGGNWCNSATCGTAFKLTPPANICRSTQCPWTETQLHNFTGPPQANWPNGPVIFDQAGNLYGNAYGGPEEYGVAWELSPNGGSWTETDYSAGYVPRGGLTFDSAGNLWGVNLSVDGGIYELTPSGSGWNFHQAFLMDFENDGGPPVGGLIFDSSGAIYGSNAYGGVNNGGTIFSWTPGSGNFEVLYSLSGTEGPNESLTMDAAGNLYGATFEDGAYNMGSVFKLTPGDGGWTYTDLYDFTGGNDGANPISNVVIDAQGNLYGTASHGGGGSCNQGCGVVWEITP